MKNPTQNSLPVDLPVYKLVSNSITPQNHRPGPCPTIEDQKNMVRLMSLNNLAPVDVNCACFPTSSKAT